MLASFHKPMKAVCLIPSTLLVVALLCVGVFMQMLGVPITLWDVENTVDTDYLSFLEDIAIPADRLLVVRALFLARDGSGTARRHSVLHDHSVFHPPTAPTAVLV